MSKGQKGSSRYMVHQLDMNNGNDFFVTISTLPNQGKLIILLNSLLTISASIIYCGLYYRIYKSL